MDDAETPALPVKEWDVKAVLGRFLLHARDIEDLPKRGEPRIAKKWSRKGNCPDCAVSTGSYHSKQCKYAKRTE